MKLDFELPYAFRGRPKACRDVKDIFLTKRVSGDIPQVSMKETDVVFSVVDRRRDGIVQQQGRWVQPRIDAANSSKNETFELRTFQGNLYRKVANSAAEARKLGLFATPFEETNSGRRNKLTDVHLPWQPEYGADISPIRTMPDNAPLARPLMEEMTWILDRDKPHSDGARSAWPPALALWDRRNQPTHAHRNARSLEKEIQNIVDIDWQSMAAADAMIQAQVDRLLIVGGQVWLKSRPPAIAVDDDFKWGSHHQLHIRLVTAPEVYVSKLFCAHFSLGDLEEAREYAKEHSGGQCLLFDYTVPYECSDPTLLEYEWRSEAVNRFCYTAAVESRNYLLRNPGNADKITPEQHAIVQAAFDETMQVNHILGIHRDMSAYAMDLKAIWRKLSYRQCLAVGITAGCSGPEPAAKNLERYLDDAPISVSVNHGRPLSR
ncbi:hypothetical protein [Rhizobium sp. BK176]|uniref:hypothetical protein n=1 Tax=Rhizobium sp. BK176 TaxID=2587071 RepID=UPI00216966BC|nr:hypothetical protein [Rhizobium sp. BK176]MCS4089959.1 hypothetical protein [Rhizobium sp. BK176]